MSLFDDLKRRVSGFFGNLGSQAEALSEVTVARGAQERVAPGTLRVGGTTLQPAQAKDFAELANQQIPSPAVRYLEEGERTLGERYYDTVLRPWSRVVTTGTLLLNADTYRDTDSLPEALTKAWGGAKDISPAQSVVDLVNQIVPGQGFGEAGFFKDIDIYDPAAIEEVYEGGSAKPWSRDFNPNKLASGFTDLIWGVTGGDPIVVGGLTFRAARLRALDPEFSVLDEATGPQRSKYEAELREKAKAETLLEQQLQYQSMLRDEQLIAEDKLRRAQESPLPDIGPEPTFDDAFEVAQRQIKKEGTARKRLKEDLDLQDVSWEGMTLRQEKLYNEYGVIPLKVIRQQLDPSVPPDKKPLGPFFDEETFNYWFATGKTEVPTTGEAVDWNTSGWGVAEYEQIAKAAPDRPLTEAQLRGRQSVTRRNKSGSFTTYDRTMPLPDLYVEVPWLKGGRQADEQELMDLADNIYGEMLDEYDRALNEAGAEREALAARWAEDRQAFEDELIRLDQEIPKIQERVDELRQRAMPRLAKNMDHFVRQVVNFDMKAGDIARHRWVQRWSGNPELTGQLIEAAAKSGDPTDIVDSLLVMRGDQAAFDRLAERRELLAMSIKRIQGEMSITERMAQSGVEFTPLDDARMSAEYQQTLKRELELMMEEDAYLRKLVGNFYRNPDGTIQATENSAFGLLAAARGPAKIQAIETMRARRAMRKAYYSFAPTKKFRPWTADEDWDIVPYQSSPLMRPVYVAEFIGARLGKELPTGVIPLRGLEDFEIGPELTAWLNSNEAWNTKAGAAIKQDWYNRILAAPESSVDPNIPSRAEVLAQVENASIVASMKRYGIDPEAQTELLREELAKSNIVLDENTRTMLATEKGKKKYPEAARLLEREKAAQEVIDDLVTRFRQKRAMTQENIKEMGFYVTEDDGIGTVPLTPGQIDDSYFLPDMALWNSYIEDNKVLLNAAIDEKVLENLTGRQQLASVGRKAKQNIMAVYNEFDRVWRPSVLIRLGYTQRNILTELLKVSAFLDGGIFELYRDSPKAAENWAKNRWDRYHRMRAEAAMNAKLRANGVEPSGRRYKVDVKQYEDFLADQVADARAKMKAAEEYGDPVAMAAAQRQVDAAVNDLKEFGEYVTRQGQKGNRYATGKGQVYLSDVQIAGAYGGAEGDHLRALVSSGARLMEDLQPIASQVTAKQLQLANVGNFGKVMPTAPNYFTELAAVVNRQFRNSMTLRMLFSGKDDMEILTFLRSDAGRQEMGKVRWPMSAQMNEWDPSPEGYLAKIKDAYERYLPNDEAKAAFIRSVNDKTDLTPQELRAIIPVEDAGIIHGRIWEEVVERTLPERILNLFFPKEVDRASSGIGALGGAEAFGGGEIISPSGLAGGVLGYVIGGRWSDVTKKIFRYIGTLPEDALIRHPFANAIYRGEMAKMISRNLIEGQDLRPDTVIRMQTAARKIALRESRSLLYSVVRKSSLANSMVMLSPFFQAQMHTLKAWSRIAYEKPQNAARIANLYARLSASDYVETDPETGQQYIAWSMPESWWQNTDSRLIPNIFEDEVDEFFKPVREMLRAKGDLRFSVQSFNMIFQGARGDTFFSNVIQSFGPGPILTIPITAIVKKYPDMDERLTERFGVPIPARDILEAFVPASAITAEGFENTLLPTMLRRVRSTVAGLRASGEDLIYSPDNAPSDWAFHAKYFFDYRYAREELGMDAPLTDEQRWKLATRDTAYFFGMRLIANLGSGFIPQYDGALTPYIEIWRQYQNEDPVGAFDRFYADFPEFINITGSLTSNETGASPTTDAVFMYNRNRDLISDVAKQLGPEFTQMGTNRQFADIEYDGGARAWQIENQFRGAQSGEDSSSLVQIRKGWADYRNEMTWLNSKLAERGLTSLSQNGAEDLADYKRRWIAQQEEANPDWYYKGWSVSDREGWRTSVVALRTYLADERFMSYQGPDSWFWAGQAWLEERDWIEGQLAQRAREGGSQNIDAQSNADLRVYRDNVVAGLTEQNPVFGKVYLRFFDNDKFLPVRGKVER